MEASDISSKGKDFLETRVLNRSENEEKILKAFSTWKNVRVNNCVKIVYSSESQART